MKTYDINIHFDAAITMHGIVAESEEAAKKIAYQDASQMNLFCAAMKRTPTTAEVVQVSEPEAWEVKELENNTVWEFGTKHIGYMVTDIECAADRTAKLVSKLQLAALAFGEVTMPWNVAIDNIPTDHPQKVWLTEFYTSLANGTHPRTEFFNRCARMYARMRFQQLENSVAKALYDVEVDTTDKVWQKGAVSEGLKVLCDKMDEYVCNNDEPDYKGNEPQMIVRYQEDPDDEEDYWNLFLYCTGPNDSTDDKDFLAIRGAWQHVWYTPDGKEDIDDYDMMEWNSRRECMQYLFYTPADELHPRPDNMYMTQIWVEN